LDMCDRPLERTKHGSRRNTARRRDVQISRVLIHCMQRQGEEGRFVGVGGGGGGAASVPPLHPPGGQLSARTSCVQHRWRGCGKKRDLSIRRSLASYPVAVCAFYACVVTDGEGDK
jgi:hypothetical protein